MNYENNYFLYDLSSTLLEGIPITSIISYNYSLPIINENELFNNDFPELFFRFLVVINYLKIKDLKDYLAYSGTGFADFTSLLAFSQLSLEKIRFFIKKHSTKIQKYYSEIS